MMQHVAVVDVASAKLYTLQTCIAGVHSFAGLAAWHASAHIRPGLAAKSRLFEVRGTCGLTPCLGQLS